MSNVQTLKDFVVALNSHDLDRIMSFFCDDCVFFAAAGEAPNGHAYRGKSEVRAGFQAIFDKFKDAVWVQDNHFTNAARGFSEWTFQGTDTEGNAISVHGCDGFIFQGDLIRVKDSFRKQV